MFMRVFREKFRCKHLGRINFKSNKFTEVAFEAGAVVFLLALFANQQKSVFSVIEARILKGLLDKLRFSRFKKACKQIYGNFLYIFQSMTRFLSRVRKLSLIAK